MRKVLFAIALAIALSAVAATGAPAQEGGASCFGEPATIVGYRLLATVAACRPSNLTVILWVNGHYESSGGQSLPSAPVDWPVLARGLGIAHVQRVGDVAGLRAAFPRARAAREPALLVLDVAFDRAEPIPPYSERPDEIRARFKIA